MRIWIVRAGAMGRHAEIFERLSLVALTISPPGDVTDASVDEIEEAIRLLSPSLRDRAVRVRAGYLFRFASEMRVGDVICTPDTQKGELLFGILDGLYAYRDLPDLGGFVHSRSVEWEARVSAKALSIETSLSLKSPSPVFPPKGADGLLLLYKTARSSP